MADKNSKPNPGFSEAKTEPPERPPLGSHALRQESAAPQSDAVTEPVTAAQDAPAEDREPIAAAPFPMDSLTLTELQETRKAMTRVAVLTLAQNMLLGMAIALAFGLYAKANAK